MRLNIYLLRTVFFSVIVSIFFLAVSHVQAVDLQQEIIGNQLSAAASGAQVGQATDPRIILSSIIQVVLSLLGTFFLVLIVMSGYWLVTARGDESKVEKAQSTIRGAIIGLAIILMAYGITVFVTSRVLSPGARASSNGPTLRFSNGFQSN